MGGDGDALRGLRFAVVTASTTRTAETDGSGHALTEAVRQAGGVVAHRVLVRDDRAKIADILQGLAATGTVDVILTTGGTGLGPYDVTPEATKDIAERDVPGLAELLRAKSLGQTPYAALSRGVAVMRGTTLIVNLPGSPAGARDGLAALLPLLAHAVAIAAGGGHR